MAWRLAEKTDNESCNQQALWSLPSIMTEEQGDTGDPGVEGGRHQVPHAPRHLLHGFPLGSFPIEFLASRYISGAQT